MNDAATIALVGALLLLCGAMSYCWGRLEQIEREADTKRKEQP